MHQAGQAGKRACNYACGMVAILNAEWITPEYCDLMGHTSCQKFLGEGGGGAPSHLKSCSYTPLSNYW